MSDRPTDEDAARFVDDAADDFVDAAFLNAKVNGFEPHVAMSILSTALKRLHVKLCIAGDKTPEDVAGFAKDYGKAYERDLIEWVAEARMLQAATHSGGSA